MSSRIKSLFATGTLRNNDTSRTGAKGNTQLRAYSYDSVAAGQAPLRGSYPVAGNGPNPLEQLQRTHAERLSRSNSHTESPHVSIPPGVPRRREDRLQGARGEDSYPVTNNKGKMNGRGRTFSLSSRSHKTNIFSRSRSRRNSAHSPSREPAPPLPDSPRDVQIYQQVTKSPEPPVQSPPGSRHTHSSSSASRRAYVDLLDASSTFNPSQSHLRHRTRASGVKNYGEDVADRNMRNKNENGDRDSKLDLSSPEFSYLKSVYSAKKKGNLYASVAGMLDTRAASALGHVLGDPEGSNDDTTPVASRPTSSAKSPSIRSTFSQTKPAEASSSSGGPASEDPYSGTRVRVEPQHSTGAPEPPNEHITPQPAGQKPVTQGIPPRDPKRHSFAKTVSRSTSFTVRSQKQFKEPPPVAPASKIPQPDLILSTSSVVKLPTVSAPGSSHSQKKSMSTTNQSPGKKTAPRHKNASTSYSAFPTASQSKGQDDHCNSASKPGYTIKDAKQPPSLEGVVDLTNTTDTEVTTKQLPAVTHEHVTNQRHEIRQEAVTRETHDHDVYHRVLPVIETEILPAKHYIKTSNGRDLIEIPESKVPNHSLNGKPNGNWRVSKDSNSNVELSTGLWSHQPRKSASASFHEPSTTDAADAPVVSFSRLEKKTRSQASSMKSFSSAPKKKLSSEPTLSSKKEYTTEEGIKRTEYVWHHPPVFETADGKTTPVYIGAGLGDISPPNEDDDYESVRNSKTEEALLFRDSGYGPGGMLPGLAEQSPMASVGRGTVVMGSGGGLGTSVGKVKVDEKKDEDARRKKAAGTAAARAWTHSQRTGGNTSVADMNDRVGKMSIR